MTERKGEPIYEGSDGNWYTCWQVEQRLLGGVWDRCLEDRTAGLRLVESVDDDELIMLTPIDVETLPPWLEVRSDGRRSKVVDTRRGVS